MTNNINGQTATLALLTEPASRPVILGPDTDAPGHPGWCLIHTRDCGDGVSVCLGGTYDVESGLPGTRREWVGASLARATGASLARDTNGVPEVHLTHNGTDGAIISPAAAREYAALLNYLAAQAENAAVN